MFDIRERIGPSVVADPEAKLYELVESGKREIVLAGSAGTGKTTLLRSLLQKMPGRVILLSSTGRAARRMTEVTGLAATTVHSGIYGHPTEDHLGNLIWPQPRTLGEKNVVVATDEASMIDQRIADDLRHAVHRDAQLLVLGDPYQLPPIEEFAGFNLREPDLLLTKVWRSGGGIMDLAYLILSCETYDELRAVWRRALSGEFRGVVCADGWTPERWRAECLKASVDSALITYTNSTRKMLNIATRHELGYPHNQLMDNEVLCLISNNKLLGICNGDTFELDRIHDDIDPDMPLHLSYITVRDVLTGRRIRCYVDDRGFGQDTRDFREARREDAMAWEHKIHFKNPRWAAEYEARERGEMRGRMPGPPGETAHFTFGYASTAHREQGNEHDVVGVVWDSWRPALKDLEFAKSWLYTTVTRARHSVVLFR